MEDIAMTDKNNPTKIENSPITSDIKQYVLNQRYLFKDNSGNIIETPDDMYLRVASTIASVEAQYGGDEKQVLTFKLIFYQMMKSNQFLPNSPTLMNAGRPEGLLSACFVLPIPDSIDGIFDTIKHTALIQKAGGGTGFSFDTLRPTGDFVKSSGGTTSGPMSFWQVLAETTNAIQQGANRRGANMGMMSIDHPDILKFINAKKDKEAFNNFNISIKITDTFMKTLRENPNSPHIVTNPRNKQRYLIPKGVDIKSYNIQDLAPVGDGQDNYYTVADIWQMIVHNAHATGEPGVFFIDRANKDNPTPHISAIYATNPCGEQPLLDYESCNLGSLNIAEFVQEEGFDLNWQALAKATENAVRFLDNVIDANHWPIPQVRQATLGNRKIGLGLMGFADALVLLGIRYDSDDAVNFAKQLTQFIQEQAHQTSRMLAEERGTFPNWQGSIWDTDYHTPMRNAACTTIAPTGSISIIAGCSSGIEPIFRLGYKRRALDGREFIQLHPLVERLGRQQGWLNDSTTAMLVSGTPAKDIPGVPPELAEVMVTAHEIAPEWHVRIQAAIQTYTDNAVSKTVNLPSNATVDDIDRIFQLAYDLGCKGVTVYRDHSRDNQILSAANDRRVYNTATSFTPRPRVRITTGKTSKFRMGCGTLFVTVNKDDKGICEVFANLGKAGGCPSQSEATCRAVSTALRSGVDPEVLIDQLSGIRCLSAAVARKSNKGVDVLSCPDAIAIAMKEAMGESIRIENTFTKTCPECGHALRKEAGCHVCDNCAYTKCG